MASTPQRTDLNFDEFRKRLLAERAQLTQIHKEQRSDTIAESRDLTENSLSSYDITEPEDGAVQLTDYERDTALDENTQDVLKQIDHALERLDAGTYGICEVTGDPIPIARLRALPWATTTVEAAERSI